MINVSNTWNHLKVYKKWVLARSKIITNKLCVNKPYIPNVYDEMVDFGKFDKMIKISGKMEKSDIYKEVSSDISFFIE